MPEVGGFSRPYSEATSATSRRRKGLSFIITLPVRAEFCRWLVCKGSVSQLGGRDGSAYFREGMEREWIDLESYFRGVACEVAERVYEEKRESASLHAPRRARHLPAHPAFIQ